MCELVLSLYTNDTQMIYALLRHQDEADSNNFKRKLDFHSVNEKKLTIFLYAIHKNTKPNMVHISQNW